MNRQFLVTVAATCLLAACGMPEAGDWSELTAEEQALYQQALDGQGLEEQPVAESASSAAPVERVAAGTEGLVVVPSGNGGVLFVSTSSASSSGDEASSTQDPIPTKNRRDAVMLDRR